MEFEDKTLICKDCGKEFVWTKGEQRFFAEKGFTNPPVRCPECRVKAKRRREGPPLIPIRCRVCGKAGEIPEPETPIDMNDLLCEECLLKALKQLDRPAAD